MGTQVKLQAILLSNEHLQKIETNKPHTETWIYSQPHASNKFCTSTLQIHWQPRIPVPVGHRWRHNHHRMATNVFNLFCCFLCYWH